MLSISNSTSHKVNDPQFVYVLEDDMVVNRLIGHILSSRGYHVRSYNDPEQFLKRKSPTHVSCLISDINLPGLGGLDVQKAIANRGWILPIIFVTSYGTVSAATTAMKDGAVDFLEKPIQEKALLDAVERALHVSACLFDSYVKESEARRKVRSLSERELVIMRKMISGWLNKQIAAELGISERTVKSHRASVMEKLGVESIPQLVPIAMMAGVMAADEWKTASQPGSSY